MFNPKTEKIKNLADKYPNRVEELEVIWRKDSTKAFKLLTPKKIILRE